MLRCAALRCAAPGPLPRRCCVCCAVLPRAAAAAAKLPLQPPPRRFTRKLKKVTAEQGAAFVSYDPAEGLWKFQVEHFSR